MSTEENKAIVRRFYAELNRQNYAVYDELVAPDVTYNGHAIGREGMRQFSRRLRTAFPDFTVVPEEMVAEGDLVATSFTYRGTHQGELVHPAVGRLAPTGKSFSARGMDLYRIVGGRIADLRDRTDTLGVLQQLGAIPLPEPTTP